MKNPVAASSESIAAGQALEVGPGGSSFSYDNAQTTALDMVNAIRAMKAPTRERSMAHLAAATLPTA